MEGDVEMPAADVEALGGTAVELDDMKQRLKEMEVEAAALRDMQTKVEQEMGTVQEEVQQHFQSCGTVNRVTIRTNKYGQPKGYAYVEFLETEAIEQALVLNESELHGRQLKISAKRTNVPGMKQFCPRCSNPYLGNRSRAPFMPAPYIISPHEYG